MDLAVATILFMGVCIWGMWQHWVIQKDYEADVRRREKFWISIEEINEWGTKVARPKEKDVTDEVRVVE